MLHGFFPGLGRITGFEDSFRVRYSKTEIADNIDDIENPELRRRLGLQARREVEEGKFSMKRRNEALKRVLDEATGWRSA
jgi:hypothetical protein